MTTMSKTKIANSKTEELRRQLEAAEAEAAAEQREEERRIRRAKRAAGDNHTRAMLELYELLGVEPEQPNTRKVGDELRSVATDKDETLRSERLITMVEGMLDAVSTTALQKLQDADHKVRDNRKSTSKVEQDDEATEHDESDLDSDEDSDKEFDKDESYEGQSPAYSSVA